MKIIDSHCHAWAHWPYSQAVPDPESRGIIEQLLYEMDQNGVDEAAIVCAQIKHNPENNAYIAQQVTRYPDRLHQLADIASMWSPDYHQPGAADRLQKAVEEWRIKGFTHYVHATDDGEWLRSDEGLALFQVAADNNLIASIHCQTQFQPTIRYLAERFPSVPILCHHLGHVPARGAESQIALQEMLASANLQNIYIKLSGYYYAIAEDKWDYPYNNTHSIVKAEYEYYGRRMCWGSDYPVVRAFMTYKQALEAFRTHCKFVAEDDMWWILGETLDHLLQQSGVS
ncbi:MAG: amidohydrolase family protein [Anaerolineae bacterium]|nr:amidohydrolase family protein [Anaerolineae bacterium]